MDRRAYLCAAAGLLAGCSQLDGAPETGTSSRAGASGRQTTTDDVASYGFPASICSGEVYPERIPAIVDPAFASDWTGRKVPDRYRGVGTEPTRASGTPLPDHGKVIGVQGDTEARAYPLAVLFWHEVVNDTLEQPLLITFCPNCSSGVVARRMVNGTETTFGVTGQLWKAPDGRGTGAVRSDRVFGAANIDGTESVTPLNEANLVMFDRLTGSYWSQLLAQAICGPEKGSDLSLLPGRFTSWGQWREAHPDTSVMLPPPHSATLADDGTESDG